MARFFDASQEVLMAQEAGNLDRLIANWLGDPSLDVEANRSEPVVLKEGLRQELTEYMHSCLQKGEELSFVYFQTEHEGKPTILRVVPVKNGYPTCDWNDDKLLKVYRRVREFNERSPDNRILLGYGHFHIPPHGPIFSNYGANITVNPVMEFPLVISASPEEQSKLEADLGFHVPKSRIMELKQSHGLDYCTHMIQKGGGIISPYHVMVAKSSNPRAEISIGIIEGHEGGKITYHPIELKVV